MLSQAHDVLAGLPDVRQVSAAEVATRVAASGRTLVVLDDDPTGTQSVAGLPVLTAWTVADLRWAFAQPVPAFFVLTNTRSLTEDQATARNRDVVSALVEAARLENARFVIASRGDSTLRGHYPLETDVIADELRNAGGITVDGVVLAPAYMDAGRFTINGVQWLRTPDGLLPVGRSEFAKDPAFGFTSSDLRKYVEEKTRGRWSAADVRAITLADLRTGRLAALTATLTGLEGGAPVVVDAAAEDDLRVLALAIMEAEAAGKTFLYRVGPSFVRARAGLEPHPALSTAEVAALRDCGLGAAGSAARSRHGVVIVGSHVGQTTRQLALLTGLEHITHLELDVRQALDETRRVAVAEALARSAADALTRNDVVIKTSRAVITGGDANANLAIAQAVSEALVMVVRSVVDQIRPAWVVAKGGITSSEVATRSLGIRRAWIRGTLLPGMVSLWDPLDGRVPGTPYIVFAGNVGAEDSLAVVVTALRGEQGQR
jgi:uncharacterized protein YgbK (DUF1537 family)